MGEKDVRQVAIEPLRVTAWFAAEQMGDRIGRAPEPGGHGIEVVRHQRRVDLRRSAIDERRAQRLGVTAEDRELAAECFREPIGELVRIERILRRQLVRLTRVAIRGECDEPDRGDVDGIADGHRAVAFLQQEALLEHGAPHEWRVRHEPGRAQHGPVDTERGDAPLVRGVRPEVRVVELARTIGGEIDDAFDTGGDRRVERVADERLHVGNRWRQHEHAFRVLECGSQSLGFCKVSLHDFDRVAEFQCLRRVSRQRAHSSPRLNKLSDDLASDCSGCADDQDQFISHFLPSF